MILLVAMKGLGATMTKQPTIIILGDLDDIQKNKTWILFSIKMGKDKINYTLINIHTI